MPCTRLPKACYAGPPEAGQQATPLNSGTTRKQDFVACPLLARLPLLCTAGLTFRRTYLSQRAAGRTRGEEPPGLLRSGPMGWGVGWGGCAPAPCRREGDERAPRPRRFQSYFYLLTLQPLNQEFRPLAKTLCFLIPSSYLAKCCL